MVPGTKAAVPDVIIFPSLPTGGGVCDLSAAGQNSAALQEMDVCFCVWGGRTCNFPLHYYSLPKSTARCPRALFRAPAPLHDHLPPCLSRWRLQTKLQGPLLWTAQIMARDTGLTTSWASDVSPLVHSVPPGEMGSHPQCLGLRVDAVEA